MQGLILSHTDLDIFKLEGGVLENVMMVDTANISIIADHAWYDWIKLYDRVSKQFPEEKIYLRRYLEPDIDVGLAITAKIFK